MKKGFLLSIVFILTNVLGASAQCAMCRSILENNVSNGNIGIAAGINFGIMYLFFSPYIFIILLAIFWYRTSKRNANKSIESNLAG
jgi:hypothetical protein